MKVIYSPEEIKNVIGTLEMKILDIKREFITGADLYGYEQYQIRPRSSFSLEDGKEEKGKPNKIFILRELERKLKIVKEIESKADRKDVEIDFEIFNELLAA